MATPIPRTPDEIVARIHAVSDARTDMYGVERSRLLDALPIGHASDFLKVAVTDAERWDAAPTRIRTVYDARAAVLDYLPFAWAKANACRGVSSARSMAHFRGLLWLMGHDEIADPIDWEFYGKPQLVAVSDLVGFDWRSHDNGEWVNQRGDEPITAEAALA